MSAKPFMKQKNHVDSTTSNFATETPQPPAENPSTSASPPQQQDEEEEDYVIEEEEVVDEVTEFEKLELLLRQRAIKSLQKKKSSAMNWSDARREVGRWEKVGWEKAVRMELANFNLSYCLLKKVLRFLPLQCSSVFLYNIT